MAHDTYHRWHGEFTDKIRLKKAEIEKSGKDQKEVYFLLKNELHKLSDLKHIYCSSTTLQKQELLRTVFDSSLYYHNHLYRTTYLMNIFQHILLILKEKKPLEPDGNKKTGHEVRSGGGDRTVIEPLISFLSFIERIKPA